MPISFGSIALLCILSAAVLGFSIVFSFYLLMWCGCCHVSDDDLDATTRRPRRGDAELGLPATGGPPVPDPERKGIPLNSKPPRLTPQQELLRDQALEKYKRRKARGERRSARQAAREARLANRREGGGGVGGGGEYGDGEDDGEGSAYDDGTSSVTSRTTLASAATTVRTASTAAYGRGSYLLPPPHLCGVDMNDDDDEDEELRSVHSRSSRRSTGTTKSRASQGTVATIKSYMRHRQRQRLRRREEQQQVELFSQWAEAQMASSSELSPSSKSSAASSVGSHDEREATRGRRKSSTARGGRGGGRRTHGTLESTFHGGGYECRPAQPRQRSSSVASSAPRPPEEILGEDHGRYAFMGGAAGESRIAHREEAHLQAGYPATPNTFRVHPDFITQSYTDRHGGEDDNGAAVSPTLTPTHASVHVDPHPQQLQPLPSPQQQQQQQQPRRPKRTWKDVEHRAALSGFFNSPANNSFGGGDAHYDDGEAPAPFRGVPTEPSHSPLTGSHPPRE